LKNTFLQLRAAVNLCIEHKTS